MKPLRIALVHASDFGGGAERSVISLHRGLRALGHDSTVFVGERHSDEPGVVEIPYVRGMPGSRRAARWLERTLGLQDIYNPSFRSLATLFHGKFDVLHFNSLWGSNGFADIGALPNLTLSIPGIITMRENWLITGHCAYFHQCQRWRTGCGSCPDLDLAPAIPRDGTRLNWLRKKSALGKSHLHVVAISDWLKQQAEASPLLAGTKISRIYNGIDLATFSPLQADARDTQREALGFAKDDVVVLLAGQTVEGIKTGIAAQYAIEALNRLPDALRIRPLVVGHSAERVAKQLGRPAVILPFQSTTAEMARCFQVADMTLVTSEVEAFGRIAAESQACGTPVVAFGAGGIPEVVPHGAGGYIAPTGDVEALMPGLSLFAADPVVRAAQSELALTYVRMHFDQTRVAERYVCLYRDVIADFENAID